MYLTFGNSQTDIFYEFGVDIKLHCPTFCLERNRQAYKNSP